MPRKRPRPTLISTPIYDAPDTPITDYVDTKSPFGWTAEDDHFLMYWGCSLGYGFIAEHDLGRPEKDGEDRAAWLTEHYPAYAKALEDGRQPW